MGVWVGWGGLFRIGVLWLQTPSVNEPRSRGPCLEGEMRRCLETGSAGETARRAQSRDTRAKGKDTLALMMRCGQCWEEGLAISVTLCPIETRPLHSKGPGGGR